MNNVLHEFLTDVPRASAIWSALLVLALTTLTVIAARPEPDRPERDRPADPPLADEAADLRRYAEEVAVAATGAIRTARRRREAWLTAQEEADQAWQAYDEAEVAARRFVAAAALHTPRTPRTPAEYAARERWLHQAVVAAHWRGDLSARQLGDVFGHRDGWNPRLHPAEQEIVLTRAVRNGKLAAYRAATARERAAWRDAEVAAEAARALHAEAYAARKRLSPVPSVRARAASARGPVLAARWRPARGGLTLFQ
ncbi:hypothetical protein QTQ03_01280 [Micromonospora sp. WMMA1363]|uniref:hypothetical protein n=1 Tax=Micromonospora sp. WMMA1363 TaxID=3053985 RepID=UPI00259D136D|nr:hypothetical protein [Micromonospora sp. WMMA1363]MDM4718282.1 hypothetical protein [Micromonospora sp. WMMA1363]